MEREIGSEFAGYRIDELLGKGGMGMVYRATELAAPGRDVALKLILPERASDEEWRERFEREMRIAEQIEHPHAIPVLATGEHEGVPFMVMPFVRGTDLETLLAMRGARPLHARHAAALTAPIAFALDAAHELGMVHRDIKPANILVEPLSDGSFHSWLMDFGLAKHRASTSGPTKTGQWVGTIDYAAPEQINGEPIDGRTDVYALGCVLYECLAGRTPFGVGRDVSKIMAHIADPPPSTFGVIAGVPPEFDAVIHTAMAKAKTERFSSAYSMGNAIQGAAARCDTAPSEPLLPPPADARDPETTPHA